MSVSFNLDRFELLTLSEAAINHPNTRVRHRAASLYWLYYGNTEQNIPQAMTRYSGEIENWITNYEEFGIAGLLRSYAPIPSRAAATA